MCSVQIDKSVQIGTSLLASTFIFTGFRLFPTISEPASIPHLMKKIQVFIWVSQTVVDQHFFFDYQKGTLPHHSPSPVWLLFAWLASDHHIG